MLQRKKFFDGTGDGAGVRTALAGFNVDRSFSAELERRYDSIRRELQLIAKKAESTALDNYGVDIDYTGYVDAALAGYIYQLRQYVLHDNQQIKALREYLAGDVPELVEKPFVTPVAISRDALATIGGASIDPQTSAPLKDSVGNYVVGVAIGVGLLYTGKKMLDAFSDDFEDNYGYKPNITYRWTHTTPLNRAMYEHQILDGRTFTALTAAEVLRNTTQPFIGPVFYPGDHYHCRCFVSVVVEQ